MEYPGPSKERDGVRRDLKWKTAVKASDLPPFPIVGLCGKKKTWIRNTNLGFEFSDCKFGITSPVSRTWGQFQTLENMEQKTARFKFCFCFKCWLTAITALLALSDSDSAKTTMHIPTFFKHAITPKGKFREDLRQFKIFNFPEKI